MADNPDGKGATGLLQVVYWHQGQEAPSVARPRKYVYKNNLTPDEATKVAVRLNGSLNGSA